jgi:hypothetical protein
VRLERHGIKLRVFPKSPPGPRPLHKDPT